jgi:predicted TIM-barrel fold metal-dependent hydrolase
MQPSSIIDSHQHVFWHNRDDAGLVADMDEQGIEKAWLLTWEIPPFEATHDYAAVLNPLNLRTDGSIAGVTLADLLLTRRRYPERFIVGYCPHPAIGNAPALLRSAVNMHNVKVCGEWKYRILFDDPRSLELFRTAGELNLPVVLHLDVPYLKTNGVRTFQPHWYGGTVDNLERALIECPETNFIGHAPGFWRAISADCEEDPDGYPTGPVVPGGRLPELLDKYPNLFADLSAGSGLKALSRDSRHAVQFLTKYHERLLFGRDYYGGELHQFLSTLPLEEKVVEAIYQGNARKLVAC